jgi:hypothetical protein
MINMVATQYDKTIGNFLAGLCFAAAIPSGSDEFTP